MPLICREISLCIAAVLLLLCCLTAAQAAPLTVQSISADPSVLNGKSFSGEYDDISIQNAVISNARFVDIRITGFFARNITFKNTIFESSWIKDAKFKNVVFENCKFINSVITHTDMVNVLFLGGEMTYKGRYEFRISQTYFDAVMFADVIFENIKINHTVMSNVTGTVFLKNINNVKLSEYGTFIKGKNIIAVIDSVTATGGIVDSDGGSIYVVNCNLTESTLRAYDGSVLMEKSLFAGGDIAGEVIVVDKCKGNMQFFGGGDGKEWFISGTELLSKPNPPSMEPLPSIFRPTETTRVFIEGVSTPAHIALENGEFQIRNQVLHELSMYETTIRRINLQNIAIKQGDWDLSTILSGNWENVAIQGPVPVSGSSISGIVAHDLKFPSGSPWKGEAKEIAIKETTKPFTWEPVKVPTAEELGVKRPWPVITGGGGTKAGG